MTYTKDQIKNKEVNHFFKAYLADEMLCERVELIGYFDSLQNAKKACQKFANEEIDGGADFFIYEKKLDSQNKYQVLQEIIY